jgi:PAS domain S-box-containing protein
MMKTKQSQAAPPSASRGHEPGLRDFTPVKGLRQNETLFSALIARAPIGVYLVDTQMCLQYINPQALPVFRKVHPLMGRDFSEIIHVIWPGPVANGIMERFQHTLNTGKSFYSRDFTARRQDIGVEESYEWHLRRVKLPGGRPGVACFFNNISGRKRAEATQRRFAVVAASNLKLEREIVRRKAVEEDLKKSEQHQTQLSEEARHLSHQLLLAQEEERKRISRELHDVIAQTLMGINVHLASLKMAAAHDPEGLEQNIARTQQLVEHSMRIVHRFARELRPAALDDLGLIPALRTFVKHFGEETGIRVNLSAVEAAEQMDENKRTVLYRVAQEALTNIASHAQANQADVKIQKLDHAVCMTISDDGKGFQQERVLQNKKKRRLGLLGMRERVQMVRGSLIIQSAPGKGTTIRVQIPLAEVRRSEGLVSESAEEHILSVL